MTKKLTNTPGAIKAQLVKIAHERREDFNLLFIRYVQERLLYRLSQSPHSDAFVLKGATLFTLWKGEPHRPTKDLDLLGRGEATSSALQRVFSDICRTEVFDDGLVFDVDSIASEPIREDARYEGVRLALTVSLGTVRTRMQIDVGFGDATVPRPVAVQFPTFLEMPAPKLRAYAPETVIAEKLEAMVQLGIANSRMKDFFDVNYLSETFDFDGAQLANAIRATFERRGTRIPDELPFALTSEFADDAAKKTQWAAFQNRLAKHPQERKLSDVVAALGRFLEPAINAARQKKRSWCLARRRSVEGKRINKRLRGTLGAQMGASAKAVNTIAQ